MKHLIFLITLLVVVIPAFAEPLSDRTGLVNKYEVQVSGKTYLIEVVANFDVSDLRYDNGKIILKIKSSLENNLGELQIPKNVTSGELNFVLDGKKIDAKVLQNEKISFVTIKFEGNGTHTLEITGPSAETQTNQPKVEKYTIFALVALVVGIGAASTFFFYLKRKQLFTK